MEKRSLKDKLNGGFVISMDYVQKVAVENKENLVGNNMSIVYDKMAKILPNSDYLTKGLDYFLSKEDNTGETIPALVLILDYSKNRLPEVDVFSYTFDVMNKEKKIKLNKMSEVFN
jgi:hypothetical protein